MEKTKFAIAVDEIVRSVAIWLLSAIIIRYFIKQLYLIILIATAATVLITLLIRRYLAKKNLSGAKLKKCDDAMNELIVMDRTELIEKIAAATNGKVSSDAILADKTLIYPYFYGKLPLDKLNYAYNLAISLDTRLLILCADLSADAESHLDLFSDTPITVLRKNQTYEFLEKYDLVPTNKSRPKKKFSAKKLFSRSKIKGYLLASLVLLITASFSPYGLLCIIFASFNIAMSIMCEVQGS